MKKILGILLILTFSLSSCSMRKSTKSRYKLQGVRGNSSPYRNNQTLYPESKNGGNSSFSKRIINYDATISMKVKNPDSVNVQLKLLAEQLNGYVQTLGTRKSVIRVQSDSLNVALSRISKLGKIDQKIINGEDVTEKYTDISMRLENAQKARARYLELLSQAENVEAALKVEKELERLNGEIDGYIGKIKLYEHLSEYSTITLRFEEKKKLGILGYIGIGIYKGFKWLIVRN